MVCLDQRLFNPNPSAQIMFWKKLWAIFYHWMCLPVFVANFERPYIIWSTNYGVPFVQNIDDKKTEVYDKYKICRLS